MITPEDINDGSVCVQSLFVSQDFFDCDDLGENTITLTVIGTNGVVDTCEATVTVVGPDCPTDTTISGDPHILRWGEKKRSSFHGECDLVFAKSDAFHDGEGLELHVRTKIVSTYSHVEAAALRIGDNVITIDNKNHLTFNQKRVTVDDLPLTFGDYEYKYKINLPFPANGKKYKDREIDMKTFKNAMVYRLDLAEDGSCYIDFKTFGEYMAVHLHGSSRDFGDSVGLSGHHGTGTMLSRTGEVMESTVDHGHEWKVRHHERKLFAEDRFFDDSITGCKMPTETMDRRSLRGMDRELYENAKNACSNHFPEDFELCVDDIMVAGDVDMVYAW